MQSRQRQVIVGIDEAGEDRASLQIVAIRIGMRREELAIAEGCHPTVLDDQYLRLSDRRVHGKDTSVEKRVHRRHAVLGSAVLAARTNPP